MVLCVNYRNVYGDEITPWTNIDNKQSKWYLGLGLTGEYITIVLEDKGSVYVIETDLPFQIDEKFYNKEKMRILDILESLKFD